MSAELADCADVIVAVKQYWSAECVVVVAAMLMLVFGTQELMFRGPA